MHEKKNELWKLDLIETKFFKTAPRLQSTKKLLNSKNNAKLMKKLPRTREEAHAQIKALKHDLFEKKLHGSYVKLSREALRKMKTDSRSWDKKKQTSLFQLLESSETLKHMVEAKLAKVFANAVLNSKELKASPPEYLPESVRDQIVNKSNPSNPSRFFINHCQNDKLVNSYISKMWNDKDMKKMIDEIDWSFKKVRGDLSIDEKNARSAATGKKTEAKGDDGSSDSDSDSESESGSDSDSDDGDESGSSDANSAQGRSDTDNESEESEIDAEEAFEKYAAYDNLVAGSDDEDDKFRPDPEVNYNEVTDEESSEEESDPFFEEEEVKVKEKKDKKDKKEKKEKKDKKEKEKAKLPALASGYYSGGSDDEGDVDNDKVVKQITTTRKNRRGQRARQKIWEQKYGQKANHMQKEKQRLLDEREQRQREFEERQRKRELKAKLAREAEQAGGAPSGGAVKKPTAAAQKMHPSWEAKKKAEEKMKAVKFTGKKITFD